MRGFSEVKQITNSLIAHPGLISESTTKNPRISLEIGHDCFQNLSLQNGSKDFGKGFSPWFHHCREEFDENTALLTALEYIYLGSTMISFCYYYRYRLSPFSSLGFCFAAFGRICNPVA